MTHVPVALTIRQPWLWAIMFAGKCIENRTWSTQRRGPIYLHASRKLSGQFECAMFLDKLYELGIRPPDIDQLPRGQILARAELLDCVTQAPYSQAIWAERDAFHLLLGNVRPLPTPLTASGRLNFWPVPRELLGRLPFEHRTS